VNCRRLVVAPFHLNYTLTRRQRLATELPQWMPALAGGLGFCVGVAFLTVSASRWFLLLLLIPLTAYRGLFAFVFEIVFRAARPVEVIVEETRFGEVTSGKPRWHDLDGIIQVFRSEDGTTWTVLHLDGSVILIPAEAITGEQLEFLKSFALRAAAERGTQQG
jgi:hypothetical protein